MLSFLSFVLRILKIELREIRWSAFADAHDGNRHLSTLCCSSCIAVLSFRGVFCTFRDVFVG